MLFALLLSSLSFAAPRAEPVSYRVDGVDFAGTLVWDDATTATRPGLLMVPNWYGASSAAVEKAKALAGTRYVVLVADVYGKSTRPKSDDEAKATVGPLYGDRALLRRRAQASLDALRGQAGKAPIDTNRLGAIGYCFGGSAVLELARSGAVLDGVVSIHGGLATPSPAAAGQIKAPVLVLNGAADGYVSAADIAAFQSEMTTAGADWQLVQLGGAVHCFSEVGANNPGCAYDARAAARASAMVNAFFDEVAK
jgi:dienelactone hydrolase